MKKLILLLVTIILTSLNVNSQTMKITTYHNSVESVAEYSIYGIWDFDGYNPSLATEANPANIYRGDSLHIEIFDGGSQITSVRYYFGDIRVGEGETYIPGSFDILSYVDTTSTIDFLYIRFLYGGLGYCVRVNIIDPSAGIEDKDFDVSKLLVYPNPAKDIINIKFNAKESDQPVRIFSLNGQLVYENTDTRQREQNRLEVNISQFSNGLYLIKTGTEPATKLIKIN